MVGILDRTLTRGKNEVKTEQFLIFFNFVSRFFHSFLKFQINISTFALMFSEMVQYSQNRVNTVTDLQSRWIIIL